MQRARLAAAAAADCQAELPRTAVVRGERIWESEHREMGLVVLELTTACTGRAAAETRLYPDLQVHLVAQAAMGQVAAVRAHLPPRAARVAQVAAASRALFPTGEQ